MSKFQVLVTRQLPGDGLNKLKEIADVDVNNRETPLPREELLERVKNKDGILSLLSDRIDAEVMDAARNLKVISNYAVGFDNVDLQAATRRGIYVTNTPDVLTETVADLTWALILGVARRINEADQFLRSGKWIGWAPQLMLGNDVYHKTLGIIGLGRIGSAVARRAKGFHMRLLYYSRTQRDNLERELELTYMSLEELLKEVDYLTIHVPYTPSTHHLIGKQELHQMKPTAYLINTSRGRVLDERALYNALEDGIIAGAGLDVFENEPIDPKNPLIDLTNVILLPHIGSASVETRIVMANLAITNLKTALEGRPPSNLVNPAVLKGRRSKP
jgi:glyoxylate reductase